LICWLWTGWRFWFSKRVNGKSDWDLERDGGFRQRFFGIIAERGSFLGPGNAA
jgi:hypothetical protein